MGLIRKTVSVSSLGLVDFRSDKERTARYTRHTRNAIRAQSEMQAKLAEESARHQAALAAQLAQASYQQAAYAQQQMSISAAQLAVTIGQQQQTPPAGWYPDPSGNQAELRWWDGRQWTNATQPLQLPPSQ